MYRSPYRPGRYRDRARFCHASFDAFGRNWYGVPFRRLSALHWGGFPSVHR